MKPLTMPLLLTSFTRENKTEGDCACSSSSVDISLPIPVPQDDFMVPAGLIKLKLNDDFQVFLSPFGSKGASVLNMAAIEVLSDHRRQIAQPDLTSRLFSQGLLETEKDNHANDLCLHQPDTLTSWLHLTDRCNFRCSYCYLPHVREDMSVEVGRAAVESAFRSAILHNFKKIKFKYAGGEPLLQYPLIMELHSHARRMADENSLILEEVVLSNGSLLNAEIADAFKSQNIQLMISLDGLGDHHDIHRSYAGGRGSFADVSDAVELALQHGLVPNISVTVSGRTVEGLPSLLTWLVDRSLPFNLNFYRENDLSVSDEDMKLEEQKIITGILAAFRVLEKNLPTRSVLGSIVDRANLISPHTHTCDVGRNYLVFDQHGQIAKCQMQIHKPITDMTVNDPLAVLQTDQTGIQNLSVEEKQGCKTCEWKHWCAGGCPLATHRATGRYDVKSPNCNIYKALYPEALRLEGLRLLKYKNDPALVMKI